ncbi:Ca2-binding protein [Aureococcus anophagefferens]|nr:Ca2-binding protein [Aureococcus anophagefferens]
MKSIPSSFLKIDKGGSGSLELWEMLDHLDLHRTKFAKRVFSIFDEDGSNEIDFREFVVTLWQRGAGAGAAVRRRADPAGSVERGRRSSRDDRARTSLVRDERTRTGASTRRRRYCTLGRTQLVMFAFDLDRDSSGEIDMAELNSAAQGLYGKRYAANATAVNLLKHINAMNDREYADNITVDTFTELGEHSRGGSSSTESSSSKVSRIADGISPSSTCMTPSHDAGRFKRRASSAPSTLTYLRFAAVTGSRSKLAGASPAVKMSWT